ncbi:MAG: pitrilysin family protein [Rhodoferax sp.]
MFAINLRAIGVVLTRAGAVFLVYGSALAGIPIQHWTQPSGARVYLVESPAIPMLDVRIELDAGGRRDPPGQAGLSNVMAASLADGVRATRREPALDENALAEAWAELGASLSAGANGDHLSISLRTLTEPELLDKAVALAARQLAEPSFPAALWRRDRPKWIAALKEADTRPATLAARAFSQAVYGAHPYGAETTPASLMRIRVQDMAALHARMVRPCYARVSLVGAVNRAQADALVAQLLGRLPQGDCPTLPTVLEVAPLAQARQVDLAFPSAQAHVLIGQPGYRRSDPDHFALMVGNHILGGGGFGSRLTEEVREQRGLSYSVDSHFAPGLHAGAFTISLQTRPDQARQAVDLVRQILARFVTDGPTEAELQAAKDNLIGGFPLLLDGNLKLLDNVANIAWHGLPLDYLDHWNARVQRVSVADIRAAFARVLQPDRMVTVVLGASATQSGKLGE